MIISPPRSRSYRSMWGGIFWGGFGWELYWWFLFCFRLFCLGWIWSIRWVVYRYCFLLTLMLTYYSLKMLQEGHGWIRRHSKMLCPWCEISDTIESVFSECLRSIWYNLSMTIVINLISIRQYLSPHAGTYSRILLRCLDPPTSAWPFWR